MSVTETFTCMVEFGIKLFRIDHSLSPYISLSPGIATTKIQ